MSQARVILNSPIGPILLDARDERLAAVTILASRDLPDARDSPSPLLREARAQLAAWFEGRLTGFDLPLAEPRTPRGPAHRAAITAIGYGETASYGAIARRLGSSPRAVGQACARNPLPIVIPCHRVLGANDRIGHYSGGQGIITKSWLLDHEKRHTARQKGR